MKLLMIYGEPATGKSTLDLNLRDRLCVTPFNKSEVTLSKDHKVAFLGRTIKDSGKLLSTGGAESLEEFVDFKYLSSIFPTLEWVVAAIPTSGGNSDNRLGAVVVRKWLLQNFTEVHIASLFSDNRAMYRTQRTLYFSKRESIGSKAPAKPRTPPELDCKRLPDGILLEGGGVSYYTTEDLVEALEDTLTLLGYKEPVGLLSTLEQYADTASNLINNEDQKANV